MRHTWVTRLSFAAAMLASALIWTARLATVEASSASPAARVRHPAVHGRVPAAQAGASVGAPNAGCLGCHTTAKDPHPQAHLTCVECHGGNGAATTKAEAHPKPLHPERWVTAANPKASYTLLNNERAEWIRFVNPSDQRAAGVTCARCHAEIVRNSQLGSMTNSAQVYSTALYNNGSVPFKDARYAENYDASGHPQAIHTMPAPSATDTRAKGILPSLWPLPRFEVTQPGVIFRPFERGGGPKSELGNPNREDVPGQPDVTVSNRGFGTQGSIDPVFLGAQKTRLNDPVMPFMGTNDAPGDYRQSGCASCHVIYANDRDPFNSGPYAKFGNLGRTASEDPTIPKDESGHPIRHEFTRAIPSSQCITCHVHNGNGFLNTYLGYMWWDQETDGEYLYPAKQRNPTIKEVDEAGHMNPEEAASRGLWSDVKFLETLSDLNPKLKQAQFSDYHGHGWVFNRVYKRDRQGNLLDANDKIIPLDDKDQWTKAIHLKDIHLEKGMQCVDCHFTQDAHGTGAIYGDRRAAIEITCVDCHGTIKDRATLVTSGPASAKRDLKVLRSTPWGDPQFSVRNGRVTQRSLVTPNLSWDVPQVLDTITPGNARYNEAARLAKTIQVGGTAWGNPDAAVQSLAHQDTRMTCYSCHTSWTTNCYGCHLAARVNTKKPMLHNEGDSTQLYASYNPQVLRTDGYLLGIDGTIQGHKIAPVRSSSAVVLSVQNASRSWVINQAPTISAAGYNGNAFNTHVPHTVRGKETKQCTDCHLAQDGSNNAWMASVLMLGTNQVNFMGKYIYVAEGGGGFAAVSVTERDEPQAVLGSHLHKIAYPDNYARHVSAGRNLAEAHSRGGTANQVQLYGEYLLSAAGSGGFVVFDVANVGNKDFAQRIVTAPFGTQTMRVSTKDARGLAIGSPAPLDPNRIQMPDNEEQPIAPLFGYAFVADAVEGLVVVDIRTLTDGVPTNNRLARAATFNPGGELTGATSIALAGNYAYVTSDRGVAIVDVSAPTQPKVAARVDAPFVNAPRHVAIQFRYAFVTDRDGLKVIDVTRPDRPAAVPGAALAIPGAGGLYLSRTYAYVAAGAGGLVIVDIERPEHPKIDQAFTAGGAITDARDVKVGMVNTSLFAYVADGKTGLQVVELASPETVPGNQGFSPRPAPRLVASYRTGSPAMGISEGYRRDRAVDESGNQIAVFGRRGARPFNLDEMRHMFMRNGNVWTVTNLPPRPALPTASSLLASVIGWFLPPDVAGAPSRSSLGR